MMETKTRLRRRGAVRDHVLERHHSSVTTTRTEQELMGDLPVGGFGEPDAVGREPRHDRQRAGHPGEEQWTWAHARENARPAYGGPQGNGSANALDPAGFSRPQL